MRRGLVFGKFMPLHRGHQLLIDTAFSECDDVTIVIYDSVVSDNPKNMPIQKRLGWVKDLYPQAKNILALDDPLRDNPDRDKPEYAQLYADQILSILGEFDRVYTSEINYSDFAKMLGAHHTIVDSAGKSIPVSGTLIRKDIEEYIRELSYTPVTR